MKRIFYGVKNKKTTYIKEMVKSKNEFKKKQNIVRVFKIIALLVLIVCIAFPTVLFINNEAIGSSIIAGGIVGIIFASIPFFIGDNIRIKAFKEYGTPFVNMKQEHLIIYDDGVEYLYHDRTNKYPESMNVYSIPIENINAVRYDPKYHMITIIGEGEFIVYDCYKTKRINNYKSQRKFYSNSPYDIISAFEDEIQVVQLLKDMAKHTTDDELIYDK